MKIFSLIILCFVILLSCRSKPIPRHEIYNNDVEILCPSLGRKILVETSNSQEVIRAIEKFIKQKRDQGTNENYTVLRFDDKSSLFIKKIPPERLIRCIIRDVSPKTVRYYYQES